MTSHALGPTTSSEALPDFDVDTDGNRSSRQLNTSEGARREDTKISGLDARSSGPLVELHAVRAQAVKTAASNEPETATETTRLEIIIEKRELER